MIVMTTDINGIHSFVHIAIIIKPRVSLGLEYMIRVLIAKPDMIPRVGAVVELRSITDIIYGGMIMAFFMVNIGNYLVVFVAQFINLIIYCAIVRIDD